MNIKIRLQISTDDDTLCDEQVLTLDKSYDQLEILGLTLDEAKHYCTSCSNASWLPKRRLLQTNTGTVLIVDAGYLVKDTRASSSGRSSGIYRFKALGFTVVPANTATPKHVAR